MNTRLGHVNKFSATPVRRMIGMVLLVLLATKLPLRAQARDTLVSGFHGSGASAQAVANSSVTTADPAFSFDTPMPPGPATDAKPTTAPGNKPGEGSGNPLPIVVAVQSRPVDFNSDIYYKNRLEFSLEGGWLATNIPFAFDFLLGAGYNKTPLDYTLVPIIASLRWQIDGVGGPWILRGNWEATFGVAITAIPRGPESRYLAYVMGIRRNFVRRNWRVAPYFDGHVGVGNIDAKGPAGVLYAQGQDLTFTLMLGSGVRYNFSPRYAISAGMNYMHISNLYLSEPKYLNYGINVYGPMVGLNIRLSKHRQPSVH